MAKVLQIALWLTWSPRRCLKKLQPIPATGMFNLYTCYVACCLQGNTELAAPGVSASNSILAKVFLLCQQSSVCVLSIRDYRYTCKQLHMHPLYRSGKCCARQAHLRLWTTLMSFSFSLWAMLMMLRCQSIWACYCASSVDVCSLLIVMKCGCNKQETS